MEVKKKSGLPEGLSSTLFQMHTMACHPDRFYLYHLHNPGELSDFLCGLRLSLLLWSTVCQKGCAKSNTEDPPEVRLRVSYIEIAFVAPSERVGSKERSEGVVNEPYDVYHARDAALR